MSEQLPPDAGTPPFGDLAEFDALPSGGSRLTRKSIAGAAAGVVLLGASAAGFLWVSSTPGADSASAAVPPPVVSTPDATASPSSAPGAFAVSGRDIFAGTVAPSTSTQSGADATSGAVTGPVAAGSTGSTGSSGFTGSSRSTASTSSPAPARGGATSGSPTRATGAPAPAPSAPAAAPPAAAPVPTASRSTAPAWEKPAVTFDEILDKTDGTARITLAERFTVSQPLAPRAIVPATSTVYLPDGTETDRPMTDDEKTACQDSVKSAPTVEAAEKIKRQSVDCTTVKDFVWQAVFAPTLDQRSGWVVPAASALPAAALGKVTGTVRLLGQRTDQYLVQVDREPSVWIAKGAAVPGTPLTLVGVGLKEVERTDVAVFSDGTSRYFTILGGGEAAGVTY